jgi:hypothetical protein
LEHCVSKTPLLGGHREHGWDGAAWERLGCLANWRDRDVRALPREKHKADRCLGVLLSYARRDDPKAPPAVLMYAGMLLPTLITRRYRSTAHIGGCDFFFCPRKAKMTSPSALARAAGRMAGRIDGHWSS